MTTMESNKASTVTPDQLKAGLAVLMAVAETIREAGQAPAGPLYAALMGQMDLIAFQSMIRTLVNTGLVREEGHMLTWVGPKGGVVK